jgi:hypothetical protein
MDHQGRRPLAVLGVEHPPDAGDHQVTRPEELSDVGKREEAQVLLHGHQGEDAPSLRDIADASLQDIEGFVSVDSLPFK